MTSNPPSQAQTLQRRARDAARYWIEFANAECNAGRRGIPMPEIRFDLRGRGAGLALLSRRKREPDVIRINADLLVSHPEEMIEETVPHEVAHVVAYRLYGRRIRPHGEQWQAVMALFGKDPSVSHCMPTQPTRRLQRFRYTCGCPDGAELTSIRHKRAQRGAVYLCRRCGEPLCFAARSSE